jgi:hypothetical protein
VTNIKASSFSFTVIMKTMKNLKLGQLIMWPKFKMGIYWMSRMLLIHSQELLSLQTN